MLTQNYLKTILDYNPETGIFLWRKRYDVLKRLNTRFAGKQAGWKDKDRYTFYRRIRINGKEYSAHRLAWLYMTGSFPEPGLDIDHIDGNGLNNRFKNLRLATRTQNLINSRVYKTNKLGIRGVHRQGNRYIAGINLQGKRVYLGCFKTPEEASAAYSEAAKKHFGDYAEVAG